MRWMGIAAGTVLIGVAVGLFFLYSQTEVERALARGEWVHVLVVGIDNGAQGGVQADLVGVASLSPQGQAVWLTLPRELELPQEDGTWTPLYALYQGDLPSFARRLELLLGIPLPYWVQVDFSGFSALVEAVGGVEVMVEARLRYSDRSQGLEIDIHPGLQLLNGETALHYLRYRAEGTEPGRVVRTGKFLRALLGKLRALPWSRWRTLAKIASKHVVTNLTTWDALALARRLRSIPEDQVAFAAYPHEDPAGPERPDLVRLRQLVVALYQGKRPLTRAEVRVVVLNGAGVRFLAHDTRAWLIGLGFSVVDLGNADRTYSRTLVVYAPGAEDKAEQVAELLPVPVELLEADQFGTDRLGGWPAGADVVLILGEGFHVPS